MSDPEHVQSSGTRGSSTVTPGNYREQEQSPELCAELCDAVQNLRQSPLSSFHTSPRDQTTLVSASDLLAVSAAISSVPDVQTLPGGERGRPVPCSQATPGIALVLRPGSQHQL